jgi:cytochrome c biogenesis protein
MRFAVSLLSILGIASIIGTVLKQNEPYANYIIKFGQFWFAFFESLGLYDVYHSSWFLLILLFLVVSTSLCVYRNSPVMIKEWRAFKEQASEKSLRLFSHQAEFSVQTELETSKEKLLQFLKERKFQYKIISQSEGAELIAAKSGTHQRLGYILTHSAIVIICLGGLLDGNLVFKAQELLGMKKVETLDIPASKVPEISRLSIFNPSFRANMTLPEGTSDHVAFVRIRDGYLVQELPFTVGLKDFRIEHYATGQPKSFESDIVIQDPELKAPIEKTITVNHPLIYKGIAIYQSDFQDGGTRLNFNLWNFFSKSAVPQPIDGVVFQKGTLGEGEQALKVEFNDFRKFNIINLSPDGKGKPQNVGPNITYKLRNPQGQAVEYVTYMQPLRIEGRSYFISGMRESVQDEFRYLRIPVDDDLDVAGFMAFRAVMLDESLYEEVAQRLAKYSIAQNSQPQMQQAFIESVKQLMKNFAAGGYTKVAEIIEKKVPENQRELAAQTYIKLVNLAAFEAYNLAQEQNNKPKLEKNTESEVLIKENLNAFSDMFFYGSPYYFQLKNFDLKEASGLQLTRSPGQKWVYLGSCLLVLGIFAMMYIRERRVWLLVKPAQKTVLFAMSSNRKDLDFDQAFQQYREALQHTLQ